MDDDLAGRLVANVGVDCTARETADSKKMGFLSRASRARSRLRPRSKKFVDLRPLGRCDPCKQGRDPGPWTGAGADERERLHQQGDSISYSIAMIEEIDADQAMALRSIGIRTTEKLL